MKRTKKERNYYEKINQALLSYETYHPYHELSLSWIINRIDWCWKFRHITEMQKNELCDRVCAVYEISDRWGWE